MANSQTFIDGYTGGGGQITTLAQVQGQGLTIPGDNFINIRSPGKLRALFESNGNAEQLYSVNKPEDVGLADALRNRFQYENPNQGQRGRKITNITRAAARDANLVRSFLRSKNGTKFLTQQLLLQGFQAFDETKLYNPLSPYIAALKPASFGLVDNPTRHVDTSNALGGIVNGLGIGKITSAIGGLFGRGESQPAPPRSSVASEASGGFGLATFTSFLGGGDRTSEVVAPIARDDVKGLLRGGTATGAYNAPRYTKLVGQGNGGGFFKKLLSGVGRFIQNNTAIGGLLPPKQPWAAKYRADEETYDLYLNAGRLFNAEDTGVAGGGILSGILNAIGFGKPANYSLAVKQRFHATSKQIPDYNRLIITKNVGRKSLPNTTFTYTNNLGTFAGPGKLTANDIQEVPVSTAFDADKSRLRYGEAVGSRVTGQSTESVEQSDQLLNYKALVNNTVDFERTFTKTDDVVVENLLENFNSVLQDIAGADGNSKYSITNFTKRDMYPLQFAKFQSGNKIGMDFVNQIDSTPKNDSTKNNKTYQGKIRYTPSKGNKVPTRLGELSDQDRYIRPTNNVDYVNALEVMNESDFKKYYSETESFGIYGPDIIKFFFYDIVNQKYIPFNATVKGISDSNSAEWDTISYMGRADKLYYYKGFTRSISFNFKTLAHSIKELRPMWQRINYLAGLTKPANYSLGNLGGYMIAPMVQLTLGDFFKNHNVVIESVNVTVPDDAAWEVIPEDVESHKGWYYGINESIKWNSVKSLLNSSIDTRKGSSTARTAQFPREADISVQMKVLEKDLPKTGRSMWGDSPIQRVTLSEYEAFYADDAKNKDSINTTLGQINNNSMVTMVDVYSEVAQQEFVVADGGVQQTEPNLSNLNRFSTYVRYDTDSNNIEDTKQKRDPSKKQTNPAPPKINTEGRSAQDILGSAS